MPLNIGGDGHSIHTLLKNLANLGYKVESHNVINSYFEPNKVEDIQNILTGKGVEYIFDKTKEQFSYKNGYPITIHSKIDVHDFLENYINNNPNTIILTQLDLAREVFDFVIPKRIPTVLFMRDIQRNNLLTLGKIIEKNNFIHIVFNSSFTRERFKEVEKYVKTSILYPPLDSTKLKLTKHDPKFITMVNPVETKGGKLFYEVAKKLSHIQFLTVKGWHDPIDDGINFTNLPNVTVWERQDDIRKVYEITKLILVPSQCEEGFGRVAAEGLILGIPVIASKNAGLKDALGNIGYYVDNFSSTDAWIKCIDEVLSLDKKELSKHAKDGQEYAKRFDSEVLTDQFISIFSKIL